MIPGTGDESIGLHGLRTWGFLWLLDVLVDASAALRVASLYFESACSQITRKMYEMLLICFNFRAVGVSCSIVTIVSGHAGVFTQRPLTKDFRHRGLQGFARWSLSQRPGITYSRHSITQGSIRNGFPERACNEFPDRARVPTFLQGIYRVSPLKANEARVDIVVRFTPSPCKGLSQTS